MVWQMSGPERSVPGVSIRRKLATMCYHVMYILDDIPMLHLLYRLQDVETPLSTALKDFVRRQLSETQRKKIFSAVRQ